MRMDTNDVYGSFEAGAAETVVLGSAGELDLGRCSAPFALQSLKTASLSCDAPVVLLQCDPDNHLPLCFCQIFTLSGA